MYPPPVGVTAVRQATAAGPPTGRAVSHRRGPRDVLRRAWMPAARQATGAGPPAGRAVSRRRGARRA